MSQQGDLFKHVEEARSMEEVKAILTQISDRLGMQDERLERIEELLREIRSNQPERSNEESPGEEENDPDLELADEF